MPTLKMPAMALLVAIALTFLSNVSYAKDKKPKKSDAFNLPQLLNENKWRVTDDASVSIDDDSISISGPGIASNRFPDHPKKGVTFVTFSLEACAGEKLKEGTILSIGGARIGYRMYDAPEDLEGSKHGAPVEIMVYNALAEKGKRWITTNVFVSVSDLTPNIMSGGPKLTIRIDQDSPLPIWDFYLGRRLVLANLGLKEETQAGTVAIKVGQESSVRFTRFSAYRKNPLFEDENLNGLSDAFEIEYLGELAGGGGERSLPVADGPSLLESYLSVRQARQIGKEGE